MRKFMAEDIQWRQAAAKGKKQGAEQEPPSKRPSQGIFREKYRGFHFRPDQDKSQDQKEWYTEPTQKSSQHFFHEEEGANSLLNENLGSLRETCFCRFAE